MAREQLRRLAEGELRPYRAEDEPAVLALWARALPRWPVSAEAFRSKALVDPACRRAGLGSRLLAQARRNLDGGVELWSAGSGAGPYFWPGVPEDAPDGWAFLRAHGFEPTGEMADLWALQLTGRIAQVQDALTHRLSIKGSPPAGSHTNASAPAVVLPRPGGCIPAG